MRPAKLASLLDEEVLGSPTLQEALTHRSAGGRHNERLEFLGDSILNLVVSEHIYCALPDATEGDLSRLRAALVNKDALAKMGREIAIGDVMKLGPGELKSGGFRRESILADGVEAVIGAVYLLKGMTYTANFIRQLYGEAWATLPDLDDLKDPKTKLQELLQGRGLPLPEYRIVEIKGKPHSQTFKAVCMIAPLEVEVEGDGSSRRKAEQAAAEHALKLTKKKLGQ